MQNTRGRKAPAGVDAGQTPTAEHPALTAFPKLLKIAEESETNPDIVKNAPHTTPVSRLDEVGAAKELNISYPIS